MEKSLITKTGMTEYLQGAKEIERDIYTLERMKAELKEQSKRDRVAMQKVREEKKREEQGKQACIDRIDDYNADLESPFERLLKKRYYLLGTDNRYYDYTAEDRSFTTIWKCTAIIALVIGIIIGLISSELNLKSESWDDDWLYVSLAVLELIGLVVAIIIWSPLRRKIKEAHKENRKNRKKNKKTIRECEKEVPNFIQEVKEGIASERQNIAQYEKKIAALRMHIACLTVAGNDRLAQIAEIQKMISTLCANREKYYSVGIVPPDYRTMDCVYVLEQIFRNDLADTMREAVLLYEERAFRGEVLRGMQNIASHLDNLSGIMSTLRADMDRIGRDVMLMSGDLSRVYEQNRNFAADVARQNDRLYEETKLYRYAAEALEKSNQRIVDYIEENT